MSTRSELTTTCSTVRPAGSRDSSELDTEKRAFSEKNCFPSCGYLHPPVHSRCTGNAEGPKSFQVNLPHPVRIVFPVGQIREGRLTCRASRYPLSVSRNPLCHRRSHLPE